MKRLSFLLVLCGVLLVAQNQPDKTFKTENLWPDDDSFETCTNLLNLPRTREQAHHGDYSLVMDGDTNDASTRNLFQLLPANQRHEFSFWAKADKEAEFEISSWNQAYRQLYNKKLRITTAWQRYVMQYEADKTAISPTLIFKKAKGFSIWLDEFQVAPSGRTTATYSPSHAFSIGIERIGTAGDIQDITDKPLIRSFALRNNLADSQDVRVTVVIQRVFEEPVTLLQTTLHLAAGQLFQQDIMLLKNCLKQGHYTVTLTAENDMGTHTTQFPFVILDPPLTLTRDTFAGIHPQNGVADKRAGVGWIRNFRFWQWIPEKDGVYQLESFAEAHNTYGFNSFETVNVSVPPARYKQDDWCDQQELSRFLQAFVSGCRHTDIIEIQNEPDLTFNSLFNKGGTYAAERYAQMLNDHVPTLKHLRPELKIAATGVSGDDFYKDFIFTETVLKHASPQIDIIAFHPYAHARYIDASCTDIGPETTQIWKHTQKLKNLIKKYGGRQELWFGEIGWALDVNEPFQSPAALRHADYCARLLIWGKALGMKHVLYFMSDNCIERQHYYYGLWRQGRPLPAIAAFSAAAQVLEGAQALGMPVQSDTYAAMFRHRDGRLFAALWTSRPQGTTAVITMPSDRLHLRDMFNAVCSLTPAPTTTLTLTGHPVYLFADAAMNENIFRQVLASMELDSPPMAVSWQAVTAQEFRISVENLRSLPLDIRLTFSGEGLGQQAFAVSSLLPEATHTFDIHTEASINRKNLQALMETSLGTFSNDYRLELVDCPRRPAVQALPVMDSRDNLLPNDPGNGWSGPQDISVRTAVSYDNDCLYLDVDVRDDIHYQHGKPGFLWKEDALQIGFDTQADARPHVLGYGKDDLEMGFGLCPDGPAKELTFIADRSRTRVVLDGVKTTITRQDDVTSYRLAFSWKALGITPAAGRIFGMNIVAVDNDGHGRRFWMGITPGICESKNPYAFRKICLLP